MIDEALILRVERLRSSLEELQRSLRTRYTSAAQVNSAEIRQEARDIAEQWMVEIVVFPEVKAALGDTAGDLNVAFTRLLTYSEGRSLRRLYDSAIRSALRDFHARVVIPLKQTRAAPEAAASSADAPAALSSITSAFVGHSFAESDAVVVEAVIRLLQAFDIRVETGERASAELIADKVKRRIDRCNVFVGIFTRRDKLSRKDAYSTSAWVIDEKAYAIGKNKKLILLKDELVDNIGGLQGDYEYIKFDPANFSDMLIRLVEMLRGRD